MSIKYLHEGQWQDKKVVARFDFNVPLNKEGLITDPERIDLSLPTIRYLLDQGVSKLVLMSHLGRPDGQVVKKYSLAPVGSYLAKALGMDVILSASAVDNGVKTLLQLPETKVVLLENLRFHAEEEENDSIFAQKMASYGDFFVFDAFGAAHRKHASTHAIFQYFKNKAYAGFLIEKELMGLNKITHRPLRPFVAILGGAKISDKIKTIERLLVDVDSILVGGAMSYPFLKAQGHEVGTSLCAAPEVELAKKLLQRDVGKKIHLPMDHVVAKNLEDPSPSLVKTIPADHMGLDIGAATIEAYKTVLLEAKTIFWNGPMGLFEKEPYSLGTEALAKILAPLPQLRGAYTFVGGGDSVSAVKKTGLADQFSHISSGGGASLEYIEQGELPGIQALKFGVNP